MIDQIITFLASIPWWILPILFIAYVAFRDVFINKKQSQLKTGSIDFYDTLEGYIDEDEYLISRKQLLMEFD